MVLAAAETATACERKRLRPIMLNPRVAELSVPVAGYGRGLHAVNEETMSG
jgi:hypothetical protein